MQHQRNPNEKAITKDEIWNTVIKSVYGPNWQGATYSCTKHAFLKKLCPNNKHGCDYRKNANGKGLITIDNVGSIFANYAKDIDKNTIKTGITVLDEAVRLQTKTHVVIAGCSGSGKTSVTLNILRNCSKQGLKSIFGSMDMSDALVYQKLAQMTTGYDDKKLFDIYKTRPDLRDRIDAKILEDYKHVLFDFTGGLSIDELSDKLRRAKDEHGDDLKLAVFDFINLIAGPYSDANANLALIAPKLKDLANELDLLVVSLAQTARDKGGPATPLLNSRIAKGSSAIEESATVLLGVWREGYNSDNDNSITVAGLKVRMGREFRKDLYWDGQKAEIRAMTEEEEQALDEFRATKDQAKGDGWGV